MKTLALRFGETFSPECGTIKAHQQVIDANGFVWYGKIGAPVSDLKITELKKEKTDRILLIHSGGFDRWWAYVDDITKETPKFGIPEYYKKDALKFRTWFKITRFEAAPKDVMSKCVVISSKRRLSEASRYSMNPCFYVEIDESQT